MKLYCLVNNYLSGIRAGAQAVHGAVELTQKYFDDSTHGTKCVDMINDWNQNHKTVAIVYGGEDDDLECIHMQFENFLPCAYFREPGLRDSVTCVSVLCTTDMVDDMAAYRKRFINDDEMYAKYGELGTPLITLAMARSSD